MLCCSLLSWPEADAVAEALEMLGVLAGGGGGGKAGQGRGGVAADRRGVGCSAPLCELRERAQEAHTAQQD